jgi:hypothetical protein
MASRYLRDSYLYARRIDEIPFYHCATHCRPSLCGEAILRDADSPHWSQFKIANPKREVEACLTFYRQRLQSNRASRAAKQDVGADPYTRRYIAARSYIDSGKPAARRTNSRRDDCPRHYSTGYEANVEANGVNHAFIKFGRKWTIGSVPAPHWLMRADNKANAGRQLTVERAYLCP